MDAENGLNDLDGGERASQTSSVRGSKALNCAFASNARCSENAQNMKTPRIHS
ncbi:hypothetical protein ACRALDRAFT_205432 [Sodiomyces alcalophilus JCM 7366]|uniref:uncharacterized protein n=1 Tax=Sodiomyces alcalophilus JCM 7366 TaxID=591952 RepID=UPI0039B64071